MRRWISLLLAGVLLAVSLAGCAANGKTFVIGYLPSEATDLNVDARLAMAKDLGAALGMRVKEYKADNYTAMVDAMERGEVDLGFFGALSFCLAHQQAGAQPVAMRATRADKALAVYNSLLVARADSDIETVADIAGRSMAFVDPASTSGNLVPSGEIIRLLPDHALDMDALHTDGAFFSRVIFAGSHQNALQALLAGEVEVAAVSSDVFAAEIGRGRVDPDAVRILHTSADIPTELMAVRGDVPDDVQEKLRNFLLRYDNEDYFFEVLGDRTMRFVACSLEDYQPIIDLNRRLNGGS